MSLNITIIGAGEIGLALALVLRGQGARVELWDKDPSRVLNQKPLKEIVGAADYLFLCVPSQAVRPVVNSFFGFLKKKTGVVCLSKGVELKTNKFMSEVLAEVLPSGQPWALCGGPMLSEEIMKGQAGVAVLASKNSLAFKKLIKLFSGSSICLEATNDTISVAVCGVLKNIYAMALGMVDELGWGSNAKAWLVEKSLAEMESVVKKFGGQGKTVYGAAGLGDLLATGFSSFSKNREAGRTIAKTGKCCQGGEGLISFPAILKKLGPQIKKYPVLLALKKILVQKQHAQKALQDFIG